MENITGKFAISKAGHDKDKMYVIVDQNGKYVYLADGKYKTMASPKKKNIRHIRIINETVKEELCAAIEKKKAHIDTDIKCAIKNKMNSK